MNSHSFKSEVPDIVGVAERNPVLAISLRDILIDNGIADVRIGKLEDGSVSDPRAFAECKVVVLDPKQFEADLSEIVQSVRQINEQTAFVGYSFDMSRAEIDAACALGRFSFVCKSDSPEQLLLGIVSAAQGAVFVSRSISCALAPGQTSAPLDTIPSEFGDKLSPRERMVLIAFAKGQGIKQISQEAQLSERTVNTYKSRAAKKLNLRNRAEVVQYALDNKLI